MIGFYHFIDPPKEKNTFGILNLLVKINVHNKNRSLLIYFLRDRTIKQNSVFLYGTTYM